VDVKVSCIHSKELFSFLNLVPGGKAKPLKAPKKEKKEMDEDEIAFKEKQKAGMCSGSLAYKAHVIQVTIKY
jgi:Translation machinery associated TMA7